MTITIDPVPDHYSETYHYTRYPAKVGGHPGAFKVWDRDVDRPNPDHVTWSPDTVVIVGESYRTAEWHAERAEQAARPNLGIGDKVRLGDLVVTVPSRAAEYIDGVPCPAVEAMDVEFLGVKVTVTRSAGTDGAVLVMLDTEFEPDASDGGPGLRVLVNDADVYAGVQYQGA